LCPTWNNPGRTRGYSKGNNRVSLQKRGKGVTVQSLPSGMETSCAGKRERMTWGHSYIILDLEVRRKPKSLPVSSDLEARVGRIWTDACIHLC
jgi:hypothetical protein